MFDYLRREARRLGNTCRWSLEGWRAAWAGEKSLRQWTLVNAASATLAFALELTPGERALVLALGLLVLVVELLNSAIEKTVDYISLDRDPRAKRIKDMGSAAVALAALSGGLAWLVVLIG
jgi:diacylglycerol kinase (ATP)